MGLQPLVWKTWIYKRWFKNFLQFYLCTVGGVSQSLWRVRWYLRLYTYFLHMWPRTEHGFLFFLTCESGSGWGFMVCNFHPSPAASGPLHESGSLIPCLNYCLNEQEARTRSATAPPSFTLPSFILSVSLSPFLCFNYLRLGLLTLFPPLFAASHKFRLWCFYITPRFIKNKFKRKQTPMWSLEVSLCLRGRML